MGFIKDLIKFLTTPHPDTDGKHAKTGKHRGKLPKNYCGFQWTAFGEIPGHNSHWCSIEPPGHGGPHECLCSQRHPVIPGDPRPPKPTVGT